MKYVILCGLCLVVLLSGCGPTIEQKRDLGISEFQIGHLDKAGNILLQVLDQRPSDPQALYYMGRVRHAQDFLEQAIYYYQCAVDADPSFKEARDHLAKAQQQAGVAGQRLQFIP